MSRIRNFYDEGVGAWEENRRMHSEDLNFAYNSEARANGIQSSSRTVAASRATRSTACLQPINMVVADMRQTRPAGKVRPASDGASEPVADIFGGLCRSIEQCSRADAIYKEQFKYAVAGGFGAWRIMPTYMADDGDGAFDQAAAPALTSRTRKRSSGIRSARTRAAGDANSCIVAERIADRSIRPALYKDGTTASPLMSRATVTVGSRTRRSASRSTSSASRARRGSRR